MNVRSSENLTHYTTGWTRNVGDVHFDHYDDANLRNTPVISSSTPILITIKIDAQYNFPLRDEKICCSSVMRRRKLYEAHKAACMPSSPAAELGPLCNEVTITNRPLLSLFPHDVRGSQMIRNHFFQKNNEQKD